MLKDCPELLDLAAVDLIEQVRPDAFDMDMSGALQGCETGIGQDRERCLFDP